MINYGADIYVTNQTLRKTRRKLEPRCEIDISEYSRLLTVLLIKSKQFTVALKIYIPGGT